MADESSLAAVRRKLGVTWEEASTEDRIADVVAAVSPALAARLGYPDGHAFSASDGPAWPLFLNACLYEWSDALDDFWANYSAELAWARALVTAPTAAQDGGGDGSQG